MNTLKPAALNGFRKLAAAAVGEYPLPDNGKLAESAYFTQKDADAPLSLDDIRRQTDITQ
jgi:hypothetical protein